MSLGTAPVTTVVQHDDWPDPRKACRRRKTTDWPSQTPAENLPGSTLDELRVFVSQWHNLDPRARAPYRVIQFAVNPFKPCSEP